MNIFKVLSVIGLSTITALFIGFLKGKLIAVYFGSAGLGIWAQVSNLFMICGSISLFGLNQGLVKEILTKEKHEVSDDFIQDTLSKSLFFSLSVSILILIIIICCAGKISSLLFNNVISVNLIIFISVFLPLQAAGDILGVFLLANREIKKFAMSNILISVTGLIVFIVLIKFFKLNGAYYSVGIYGIVTFISFYLISKPLIRGGIKALFTLRKQLLDYLFYKSIIQFGSLRLIQANINLITALLIRSLIIKKAGLSESGFFEALNRFSMFYTPLISNILWSYTFPMYCGNMNNQRLNYEVNKFTQLFFILFVPVSVIVMVFGATFVNLLFSKTFYPVIFLFSSWFIFDLLRIASWPIGLIFLVRDKMKTAASLEFFLSLILLTSAYLTIGKYSLKGVVLSYVFAYCIFLAANYLIINKNYGIRFNTKTILMFCVSVVLIIIAGRFPKVSLDYAFIIFLSLIFLITAINKQEMLLLKDAFFKTFIRV